MRHSTEPAFAEVPASAQQRAVLPPAAAPDFAALLGPAAWARLDPAIRARFSRKPGPGRPIRHRGVMHQVQCSALGWLVAQLCRVIGTPFALRRGADVPVTISLRHASGGAIAWERTYHYPHHGAALVRSEKAMAADGTLIERVGGGFAMKLILSEAGGALHFHSSGYRWQCGRWALDLPHWLSPGAAHVLHQDLGAGRFRFTMTIRHTVFGTLFHQDGVFSDEGALP